MQKGLLSSLIMDFSGTVIAACGMGSIFSLAMILLVLHYTRIWDSYSSQGGGRTSASTSTLSALIMADSLAIRRMPC
jgi:hypothetical protein